MEASDFRADARAALSGNWLMAVLVCFVANLITGSGGSVNVNSNSGQPVQIELPYEMDSFLQNVLGITAGVILAIAIVLMVVSIVLSGVINLGKARYFLNLIDRKEADFSDLFSCFSQFGRALSMELLTLLMVLGGTLLLVVPGIMLMYSYAMSHYILLEDPTLTGWEAMQRSRAMMKGHRFELFWLELTFLGWEILAAFTLGIGSLFLNPYKEAARASFYRSLQNTYREQA